jgi:hypothetical protein
MIHAGQVYIAAHTDARRTVRRSASLNAMSLATRPACGGWCKNAVSHAQESALKDSPRQGDTSGNERWPDQQNSQLGE